MSSAPQSPAGPFVTPLPTLSSLTFDGPDAASFLHGQLSTDVAGMAPGSAGWTSYNSPKGRMLATLLLWRRGPESFVAFAARDLADALRKRLRIFVLRAKVAVGGDDAPALLGVMGTHAGEAVRAAFAVAPAPGEGVALPEADVVATPDGRYLVHVAPGSLDAIRARIGAPEIAADHWDWLGVRAGIALVTRATQDLFIAQTANFDLVGGINFKKGCYPGQEIVARVQYLGRLKERMYAFHAEGAPPAPGTPIVAPDADPPTVGTVVNAAPAPHGGSDFLAVMRFDALDRPLHVGSPAGPALARIDMAYAVPPPGTASRIRL